MTRAWPEGAFYDYDSIVDSRGMGYRGPQFGWAAMPDQFTLDSLGRAELTKGHAPLGRRPAGLEPRALGATPPDGAVGAGRRRIRLRRQPAAGDQPAQVLADPVRTKAAYATSIAYSLDTLISFVQRYGDDDTVVVFLGDTSRRRS